MVNTVLIVLGVTTCLAWLAFVADLWTGRRYIRDLGKISVPEGARRRALPAVSVVIAARNEQAGIRDGLDSVLGLDYPDFEVIVVDDRSEDATAAILAEISASAECLRIERIESLPRGWLGKNHALQKGADLARGEIILFTDADVVLEPSVLSRAVRCLEEEKLDHLAVGSDVRTSSLVLELFVAAFALLFNGYFRPWRAADPKSRAFIGIGAFNLVRAETYRRIGGHDSIAMRPDDDVRLGRIIKKSGARQMFALPSGLLRVEWYPNLREAIRGLEKNSLAGVDYSLATLAAGFVGQLVFITWPYVAIFVTGGAVRLLNAAVVITILSVHLGLVRATSLRAWTAFALPIGIQLVQFATLRAVILTWWRGGITWRGTHYSIGELKGGDG